MLEATALLRPWVLLWSQSNRRYQHPVPPTALSLRECEEGYAGRDKLPWDHIRPAGSSTCWTGAGLLYPHCPPVEAAPVGTTTSLMPTWAPQLSKNVSFLCQSGHTLEFRNKENQMPLYTLPALPATPNSCPPIAAQPLPPCIPRPSRRPTCFTQQRELDSHSSPYTWTKAGLPCTDHRPPMLTPALHVLLPSLMASIQVLETPGSQ